MKKIFYKKKVRFFIICLSFIFIFSFYQKGEAKGRIKKKNYITYRVKKGDTLYRLSKKFKVSVETIVARNRLSSKNSIKAGNFLKIPVGKKKAYRSSQRKNRIKKGPKFNWPLKKIYNYKRDGLKGVKPIGLIIKGKTGSSVISSASGKVSKVDWMRGFGHYVVVEHQNKYLSIYANLGKIFVKKGQKIKKGKAIGRLAKTENCLHFQIGHLGEPKNPLAYLPKRT